MSNKVLPGNETVLLIPAIEIAGVPQLLGDTVVPFTAPTSAVLNKWLANVSTATLSAGGNVSCAIKDDIKLEQTASDTDKDKTICTFSNSEIPTFYKFDCEMNGFRDASLTATGLFNLFRDLTFDADVPYVVAQRIGFSSTTAAAVGQDWNFFYAWTDNQVPGYADGGNQTVGMAFVPKNIVNLRFTLTV